LIHVKPAPEEGIRAPSGNRSFHSGRLAFAFDHPRKPSGHSATSKTLPMLDLDQFDGDTNGYIYI
jgi:hypothetical protein